MKSNVPIARKLLDTLLWDVYMKRVTDTDDIADRIVEIFPYLHRVPPVRKAPPRMRTPTKAQARAIRKFAKAHSDVAYHFIAMAFGVNAGRVCEAVTGRKSR